VTRRRADARKARRKAESSQHVPENRAPSSRPYRVGRLIQFVGLLILPFGIASELVGKVGLGQSLLIAAGGALLFYAGYVTQHGAGAGH
jgi:hypothetical protein